MQSRVYISGMGVVSPLGMGRERFWNGLAGGENGMGSSETSKGDRESGAAVRDFDPAVCLGAKGLRFLDRAGQFTLAAADLALKDAGLFPDAEDRESGLVLGTAFGGLRSQQDFNRERLAEGARFTSAARFPNTPINGPSYQTPIRYGMRLINTTLSAGMASGMEALRYGASLLGRHPRAALLCGGVEELSVLAREGARHLNEWAGPPDTALNCPFDQRRNGYVLGEGCALLVLETQDGMQRRGGEPMAEIRGSSSGFVPAGANRETRLTGLARIMRTALDQAEVTPERIGYVAAAANSSWEHDGLEAQAIAAVLGERVPVGAVKSMIGESFGAGAAFQIGAGLLALQRGILAPILNFERPDPESGLDYVRETRRTAVKHVLVNALDRWGAASCLVLSQPTT